MADQLPYSNFSDLTMHLWCNLWREHWTKSCGVDCSNLTDKEVGEILAKTNPIKDDEEA